MYEVVMLRKSRTSRKGCYIKKFKDLESLADYLTSHSNISRLFGFRGLTRKEQQILSYKYYSMDSRKEN